MINSPVLKEKRTDHSTMTSNSSSSEVRLTAIEVVCAFLAVLELVKQKAILVYQNKLFGDIRIMKTEQKKTDG